MLHCRVHCSHPAVLVLAKRPWVIHVHLDQVLVEAIVVTRPATAAIQETAVLGANECANQTGPSLGSSLGTQQIVLRLLRQGSIRLVAAQVTEMGPFKNQCANFSNVVPVSAAVLLGWVQKDGWVGDAAGRVKCHAETVSKCLRLLQEGIDSFGISSEVLVRTLEQVITWTDEQLALQSVEILALSINLPDRRPPRYRMLVSNSEMP